MEFSFNGHWGFIWPSYAITAIVLGGLIALSLRAYIQARDAVRRAHHEAAEREEAAQS